MIKSQTSNNQNKKIRKKLLSFKEWCTKKCNKRVLPKGAIQSKRYSLWDGRIWDRLA